MSEGTEEVPDVEVLGAVVNAMVVKATVVGGPVVDTGIVAAVQSHKEKELQRWNRRNEKLTDRTVRSGPVGSAIARAAQSIATTSVLTRVSARNVGCENEV